MCYLQLSKYRENSVVRDRQKITGQEEENSDSDFLLIKSMQEKICIFHSLMYKSLRLSHFKFFLVKLKQLRSAILNLREFSKLKNVQPEHI